MLNDFPWIAKIVLLKAATRKVKVNMCLLGGPVLGAVPIRKLTFYVYHCSRLSRSKLYPREQ